MGVFSRLADLLRSRAGMLGPGTSLDDITSPKAVTVQPYAPNVVKWANPLTDTLSPDGYGVIYACDATSAAMRKLEIGVSRYKVAIECPRMPAFGDLIQHEIIDNIRDLDEAIRWLSLAEVDGWRVLRINQRVAANGELVPDFRGCGRSKQQAGGNLVWDGQFLYKALEPRAISDPVTRQAAVLNRDDYVLHVAGLDGSSEGQVDVAWRLYNIAVPYQELMRLTEQFTERFGAPGQYVQGQFENLPSSIAQSRMQEIASQVGTLPRSGVMVDALVEEIKAVQPPTGVAEFLIGYRRQLRNEACEVLLGQSLTSSTADSGPTGSSMVAERTEDEWIAAIAEMIAGTLDVDLGSAIRRMAPWTGQWPWRLVLRRPQQPKPVSVQELLSAFQAGIPMRSDDVYSALGISRPLSVGDVVSYEAPRPVQLVSQSPAVKLAGKAVRTVVPVHELDSMDIIAMDKVLDDAFAQAFSDALRWAVRNRGQVSLTTLPEPLVNGLATARALAHIAGIARMRSQIDFDAVDAARAGDENAVARVVRDLAKSVPNEEAYAACITMSLRDACRAMAKEVGVRESVADRIAEVYEGAKFNAVAPTRTALGDKANELWREFESRAMAARAELVSAGVPVEVSTLTPPEASVSLPAADIKRLRAEARLDEGAFETFARERDPKFSTNLARTTARVDNSLSYGQGQEQAMLEVSDLIGGWMLLTAGDARVRDAHRAMSNKAFPLNRRELIPPNGYSCRCSWVVLPVGSKTMSDAEIDALIALNTLENGAQWALSPLAMARPGTVGGPNV